MTKNLTTLSKALLGKFLTSQGKPVSGKFSLPEDLDGEISALQNVLEGNKWSSCTGVRVFDFIHEGAYCLALTLEFSDDDLFLLSTQSDNTINPLTVPGSVFLYLANCLDLRPITKDSLWVEEHIDGPANDEGGVELETVKQVLEGVSIFQISENSIFEKQISGQYIANYICTFDSRFKGSSRLSSGSLEIIREIFLQEKDRLIEENLFEAMKTPLLRHAFLEVYRTLEFVFVLPRANALLEKLRNSGGSSINIKILDFARHCNKELGWKRVERDSLGKLFQECAKFNWIEFEALHRDCKPFESINAAPNNSTEEGRQAFIEKIASRYYDLRNQIVHQFWPDEVSICNDKDWQKLIEFTLICIKHIYTIHLTEKI